MCHLWYFVYFRFNYYTLFLYLYTYLSFLYKNTIHSFRYRCVRKENLFSCILVHIRIRFFFIHFQVRRVPSSMSLLLGRYMYLRMYVFFKNVMNIHVQKLTRSYPGFKWKTQTQKGTNSINSVIFFWKIPFLKTYYFPLWVFRISKFPLKLRIRRWVWPCFHWQQKTFESNKKIALKPPIFRAT